MKTSIRGLLVDHISNSSNLHHKNCMIDRNENYYWDLGSERVKQYLFVLVCSACITKELNNTFLF